MITPTAEAAAAENSSRFWTSCCVRLDKRAVVYFTQLVLGVTIIGFCIGMLVSYQDCNTFARWSPLLSFTIGVFLPGPKMRED